MTDAERLLLRHGAVSVPCRSHRAYVLDGVRFTFSRGTKDDWRALVAVRSKLRKMGYLK